MQDSFGALQGNTYWGGEMWEIWGSNGPNYGWDVLKKLWPTVSGMV